ncbi:GOLPH3/VPS74 family protein [Streptomyces hesseae]|uniref:GPP34 family phosphoprotein n=1 Tax=Streptomyces hesseae TaxID=3075519 RepID=A0ABU2SLQ3_9ACTN|nr:GPP34 family phosphoprotein [Streptomyces sp. DSM 40473]MDT0448970.1 GPP34 family phosphoprotein [Streptomyces sp. DSM 40473]
MSADGAAGLTLPEELILLSHDPSDGKRLCRTRHLEYGLAGAVLAELELRGLVAEERGGPVGSGGVPPADQRLALPLASLPTSGGPGSMSRRRLIRTGTSTYGWIRTASRHMEEPWIMGLVERRALTAKAADRFAVVRQLRYPVGPDDLTTATRQRFEAARKAGFPGRRDRMLAGLVSATGVGKVLYPGWGCRNDRKELRRHMRDEWTAHAVHRNVSDDSSSSSGSGGDGGAGGSGGHGGHGCGGHGGCGGGGCGGG